MGILLGYSDVGYRVLVNNKIIVARHVEIVEKNVKCIGLDEVESKYPPPSTSTLESFRGDQKDCDDDLSDDNVFQSADENDEEEPKVVNKKNLELLEVPRRSTRDRKSPIRYPENISNNIYVNYCRVDTPYTFEEAMSSNDSESWIKDMDKEIESLNENKTWELVEKIPNEKVIDVKWVYSKKSNDTYKARLVVRGFQQTNVIDDIYAPVAKMQTLKVLFSFCCQNGLIIEQMDVVTAFLNGEVSSEVYVGQPKGYSDGTNKVCKLRKALYGLRESPRAWYKCLDEYLTKIKFKRSNVDYCLYTQGQALDQVYLLIYVDDLLICSKSKKKIKNLKRVLSEKFKMKDLGEVKEYLGINIEYDYRNCDMKLSQTKYIESLTNKYQLQDSRLYSTPMETNLKIEKAEICESDMKYRNLISALLYISSSTRPDISYSVNYLSRYQKSYNETHWKYALRILKYLYLTKDLKP